jgi:hypothetical protein
MQSTISGKEIGRRSNSRLDGRDANRLTLAGRPHRVEGNHNGDGFWPEALVVGLRQYGTGPAWPDFRLAATLVQTLA